MCLCERGDSGSNYRHGCNCTNRRYRELAALFASGLWSVVMSAHKDEGMHDPSKWQNILYTIQKEPPGNGVIMVIIR